MRTKYGIPLNSPELIRTYFHGIRGIEIPYKTSGECPKIYFSKLLAWVSTV
jgi:hypothetical protein